MKISFSPPTILEIDQRGRIYTNIQQLEDQIGDATEYDPFLQDIFLKHKFLYNAFRADVVRVLQQM